MDHPESLPHRTDPLTRLVDAHPTWIQRDGVKLGLHFDCPIHTQNNCFVGVHFTNPIGEGIDGNPYGWHRTGETWETLTLTPSIRVCVDQCGWHGYINNGNIQTLDDSYT